MDFSEKTINTDYKFIGEIIKLRVDTVETPGGNTATRELVEHPGGVAVVALTDDKKVIMEWQYRRPFDRNVYEIPAGKRNSINEDPLECGMRELEEETGYKAKNFTYLGSMLPTPGFCSEILHMYVATGLYPGTVKRDEDEYMELEQVPLESVVEKILSGEIVDAKTCVAVLKVNELLRRGAIKID